MRLWPKRRRSAGVRISLSVHQRIVAGDAARSRGDWRTAGEEYQRALAQRPDLQHIQVQMGHALKETGRLDEAQRAYSEAVRLDAGDRDAALQLGHLLKTKGLWTEAAQCYAAIVHRNIDDDEAMREACYSIERTRDPLGRELAAGLLAALTGVDPEEPGGAADPPPSARIVYEVTDLVHHWSTTRRPTGIQRVQLELVRRLVDLDTDGRGRVQICCFIGTRGWVAVSPATFSRLALLSIAADEDDQAEWRRNRSAFHLKTLIATPIEFASGATLVNLGASWSHTDYFLNIANLKRQRAIYYIPLIHDVIPAIYPNFFVDRLVQDFLVWIDDIVLHADALLAVSASSRADLLDVARRMGRALDPARVKALPLSADLPTPATASPITGSVAAALRGEPFVLFVATIEPRKGHAVAFDAWSMLMRRLDEPVPRLVCVGRRGWRTNDVFAALDRDPTLRERVTMLSGISDATLTSLYQASLFTIYPSLYEGWGLPVSEALSHGRVIVTTTSSSLPEAGGEWAIYVAPGDPAALASAVEGLLRDPEALKRREQMIAERYSPRGWEDTAADFAAAIGEYAADATDGARKCRVALPPKAELGIFYWLGQSPMMQPRMQCDAGSHFREGINWSAPKDWGCGVRGTSSSIAFCLDKSERQRIATMRLRGSPVRPCRYRITAGKTEVRDVLAAGECRTVLLRLAPVVDVFGNQFFRITLIVEEPEAVSTDGALEALGLIGFQVHAAE